MHAGPIELPAVELPWWDIGAGEWKVASLPPRTLQIKPSADALPPQPAAASDVPVTEAETIYVHDPFWQRISEGLAVAWLLTLCAWWWSRRRPRDEVSNEPPVMPLHKQQSRCLKAARKAATEGDSAGVQAALLEWARLEWPQDTPRSIGAVAERVSSPLSDELRAMAASRYGRDAGLWDKAALAKALRSVTVRKEAVEQRQDDGLPPLMPAGQDQAIRLS